MKRVTVYRNGATEGGHAFLVLGTIPQLLAQISEHLNITAKCLYTRSGGLISDASLIMNNDVLYVTEGETFIGLTQDFEDRHARSGSSESDSSVVGAYGCANAYTNMTNTGVRSCGSSKDATKASMSSMPSGWGNGKQAENSCDSDWIVLNVGGRYFSTTRGTLTNKEPGSMLARMFSLDSERPWNSLVDGSGAYLVDRSPTYFEPILNYLRNGSLILDKGINPLGVLEEARFFGILSLAEMLEEQIQSNQPVGDSTPISRREFVLRLIGTPSSHELRCQGVNFAHSNLSKLDLRGINFKYAILRGADLSGANLSYCNFERADLSHAVIDGASLINVKMLCVNLEHASMQGCNLEDPAGNRANLEGANMKYVNLEGSHMSGVNLRVANLKQANLQNCDLRGAVLAGADLENCDLSGCDLQEANLRGANLKGAAFELMVNPLHMSQTVR